MKNSVNGVQLSDPENSLFYRASSNWIGGILRNIIYPAHWRDANHTEGFDMKISRANKPDRLGYHETSGTAEQ